jgi:hypothetical protein
MRLAMVFIDLFWFVFVALIKVGGLTGAIIYFAEFTDQKASTGLMPLRAYTNMQWWVMTSNRGLSKTAIKFLIQHNLRG